jgi:hypothetical protein
VFHLWVARLLLLTDITHCDKLPSCFVPTWFDANSSSTESPAAALPTRHCTPLLATYLPYPPPPLLLLLPLPPLLFRSRPALLPPRPLLLLLLPLLLEGCGARMSSQIDPPCSSLSGVPWSNTTPSPRLTGWSKPLTSTPPLLVNPASHEAQGGVDSTIHR